MLDIKGLRNEQSKIQHKLDIAEEQQYVMSAKNDSSKKYFENQITERLLEQKYDERDVRKFVMEISKSMYRYPSSFQCPHCSGVQPIYVQRYLSFSYHSKDPQNGNTFRTPILIKLDQFFGKNNYQVQTCAKVTHNNNYQYCYACYQMNWEFKRYMVPRRVQYLSNKEDKLSNVLSYKDDLADIFYEDGTNQKRSLDFMLKNYKIWELVLGVFPFLPFTYDDLNGKEQPTLEEKDDEDMEEDV